MATATRGEDEHRSPSNPQSGPATPPPPDADHDWNPDPELAALLRDPETGAELRLVRDPDGAPALVPVPDPAAETPETADRRYPVVRGVPRFAGEGYVASFGRQWNRYDVARDDEDARVFRVKTGLAPEELAGARVLDAGCGGGRYARLLASRGAKVVALDLSDAVEKAAELCRPHPNALVARADLLRPPVALEAFDLVFSIGVLHHSPDPRAAFRAIAARVRPGGRLAVWLYRRNTPPQEWINSALRALTTRMPPRALEIACAALVPLGGAPLLNKTLNKIVNFSNHPDRELRLCDNFDWYAPAHQSHHTIDELASWFREEGFEDVRELRPERRGKLYEWAYDRNLIVGSGVNVSGRRAGRPR